jgi:hypothetical protein
MYLLLSVGYLPLHAVRRSAPEVGDTHHEGQVAEHGFVVQ